MFPTPRLHTEKSEVEMEKNTSGKTLEPVYYPVTGQDSGFKGVKELPPDERPYEKCFKYGARSLSDSELVAVILKCGTEGNSSIELARKILTMPDGSVNILALHHKSVNALMKIKGIGQVKAVTLKCIAEISERIARATFDKAVNFRCPGEIANYYSEEMRHLSYEQTRLICLNGSTRLITDLVLSTGLVNKALLSTREIFLKALEYQAVYIVLLHNHPGGNPKPSVGDIEMTKKVEAAGVMMDIKLLDHIIIGDASYVSMRESGYINGED